MASSEPAAMANPRSSSGMGGSPVECGKNVQAKNFKKNLKGGNAVTKS